ncbi:FES1 (YBR101C) [Zygosaccharomyces parabailii]|uniref:Hsp70 nucleotide exchange factor FES1 n=1 Tax=Zygosaccharomyces bailii (strain CLIB 213 / ATCC 58445 / CBS 680 / BCRC 21525 / NBRC 1098 / NCYC 1416 / NRRL Y-2227) TaxID=1333698 RepID=A0A8J2T940_ZYGB2|nr:FES1 (YBR101C) [Zygosaccharomyces parabailii]CDF89624.1 ZYBA0S04-08724g1_1 [Zygosaccharomyces bailii CLIB 213]CDH13743.1 probable Hsp70 nucleotide exchange factor FES1 [Zygosaccharomyces bailii ISA1307]
MEKLLHWSIANSQGDKEAKERIGQPDPKLLGQLFGMGPDEPTLMKEAMAVISNPEAKLEKRLVAFDNFEMLIENLDNANNIENLKLWEPLLQMLNVPETELRSCALSCVGTASQNNGQTQDNFLKYDGGLRKIISLAADSKEPTEVRTKALYALSNLIRNHANCSQKFCELHGLEIIPPIIQDLDANKKLKMRALSLLSAFLTSSVIDKKLILLLRKENVMESTLECLDSTFDVNVVDRVLNILSQLISAKVELTEEERQKLRAGMQKIEAEKDKLNEDDFLTVKSVL